MSKGKILVVGGYGAVGRVVSTTLGNLIPGEVIVAGRNFQKAKELSSKLNHKVLPLELDITSISKDEECLATVSIVVMCIDQKNTHFVTHCIQRGIHYIDIAANSAFLSKIESLDDEAKSHNSTVVLSVGLAPGITNLLAKQCQSMVQDMRYADIYIMLGLGEKHGEAAFRWAFEDLNDQFSIKEEGEIKQVRSFEDGKETIFPGRFEKRITYRSNFSDQHIIPKTLNIDSTSTRMCFDSAVMTCLYALLKKCGLGRLFKLRIVQNILINLLQLFRMGSDQFVVKVEAGKNREQGALYECSISGNGEGNVTGLVAAKVAEHLYMSSFASGVFHIEQLFTPLEFTESLGCNDLVFEERLLKQNWAIVG
ncbi:Saccharopine dehydrogenase [Halieaceae bacterium IMCC8485]|uniref:Saccharopine dehydrogenase n=1 Tax=Candidatus Seongchinamella marina TaxID=2518990 RepID=A0ABT3SZU3_9GAMM|nr:saccharopine dehydrogenase NADP-binding domain-containing protein [Candidatus Seongchinamella marina]MCX2975435.1 Saccharopine dehydrogenase [Candidatus Seongchinamella marina]